MDIALDTRGQMSESNQGIARVVGRERDRLRRFARRWLSDWDEAEDLVQDVLGDFVEACRLPEPIEQAGAWLLRVARHRLIDRHRKKKETLLGDAFADDEGDATRGLAQWLVEVEGVPESVYTRDRLIDALREALETLPAEQRDAFVGHELQGLSIKALAEQQGVGVNTLLARKRYAVLRLRERLRGFLDESSS